MVPGLHRPSVAASPGAAPNAVPLLMGDDPHAATRHASKPTDRRMASGVQEPVAHWEHHELEALASDPGLQRWVGAFDQERESRVLGRRGQRVRGLP